MLPEKKSVCKNKKSVGKNKKSVGKKKKCGIQLNVKKKHAYIWIQKNKNVLAKNKNTM